MMAQFSPIISFRSSLTRERRPLATLLLLGSLFLSAFPASLLAESVAPPSEEVIITGDPSPSRGFIVSVSFRLTGSQLRNRRKRILLVSKVERLLRVTKGWAVALKAGETSVRPEVFWRGTKIGGWNTFERMKIVPNSELFLSFVVRPRETISVYLQDRSKGDSPPVFLGGSPIGDAGTPRTAGDLTVSSAVSRIIIASPGVLPKGIAETASFLDGGPNGVRGRLSSEELNLWRE